MLTSFNSARSNSEGATGERWGGRERLSIPQGPIQRIDRVVGGVAPVHFQFRKVQFRVRQLVLTQPLLVSFNSARSNSEWNVSPICTSTSILSIPQGPIQSQLWDKQPKTFWTFNSAKSNLETLAPGRYLRRLRFQFRKVQFRAAGRISSTTVPRPFNSARSNSECLLCTLSLALGVLSIPQGPIQSVNFNNTTLKSEDFQFRKVQFRAPRANFVALTHPTFNSARSNSEHLRPRSNIATIQLSIPQGPIQRRLYSTSLSTTKGLSIPQGPIQRAYRSLAKPPKTSFQFRKVQFRDGGHG